MEALNLPQYEFKIKQSDNSVVIFDKLRRKYVALTPEEWVRQNFVEYLISNKHYPASLITNEISIKLNSTLKRCDTLVYSKELAPLVIVEYKATTIAITQKVFDQIVRYNMVLQAKYLIVSNGLQHYCCKIDYDTMSYSFIKEIPEYNEL